LGESSSGGFASTSSSGSTVVLKDYRPRWSNHLFGPGTLVETRHSYGGKGLVRRVSQYPGLMKRGYGTEHAIEFSWYVRMDSSVLPEGEEMLLGRIREIAYQDGGREPLRFPDSPYSAKLVPVGALGMVVTYVRVGRTFTFLEEEFLPSLDDPNFYIVYFQEYLDIVKAGLYLVPVKETKKAKERTSYEEGLEISVW